MENLFLSTETASRIDGGVAKVLRDLGNPEPPLRLEVVRDLLKLDRQYYSTSDEGVLQEVAHRLRVAGKQVLMRPTLLWDAVRKFKLNALYIPDRKRILINSDLPDIKKRWGEAHEIGHSLIPWHEMLMLGDDKQSLSPGCHAQLEAEANYAAARLLFMQNTFSEMLQDLPKTINTAKSLAKLFKNSITCSLWRMVEHLDFPAVGIVSGHPNRPTESFQPSEPCRYFIRSRRFAEQFSKITSLDLFPCLQEYCSRASRGPLGDDRLILSDNSGEKHIFGFETFFNGYEALTFGAYEVPKPSLVAF